MPVPARRTQRAPAPLRAHVGRAFRQVFMIFRLLFWAIANAFGTPRIEDPPPKNPVVRHDET